jgi:hypothetical protein
LSKTAAAKIRSSAYTWKVAIRGHKHRDLLASFSLLRRVSTERAHCYKILANVCKCKEKLVEPQTNISGTGSVLRSGLLSDANGDVIVFEAIIIIFQFSRQRVWRWQLSGI